MVDDDLLVRPDDDRAGHRCERHTDRGSMTSVSRLSALLEEPDPPLDECLLLVSAALADEPSIVDEGLAALEDLAAGVPSPSLDALLDHLFDQESFIGDTDDYDAVDNSLLDRVLRRRRGMPITLAAVLISVGRRVGVDLYGVGMPGHFLVGVGDQPGVYLDVFAGGVRLDRSGAEQRFRQLFGPDAEFGDAQLARISTAAIVSRVLNNLVRTLADRDPARLDPLIELRAALPGPKAERQLLVRIAEARGKWDVAASIREELDANDPIAFALRARLN